MYSIGTPIIYRDKLNVNWLGQVNEYLEFKDKYSLVFQKRDEEKPFHKRMKVGSRRVGICNKRFKKQEKRKREKGKTLVVISNFEEAQRVYEERNQKKAKKASQESQD